MAEDSVRCLEAQLVELYKEKDLLNKELGVCSAEEIIKMFKTAPKDYPQQEWWCFDKDRDVVYRMVPMPAMPVSAVKPEPAAEAHHEGHHHEGAHHHQPHDELAELKAEVTRLKTERELVKKMTAMLSSTSI